ncbi:MAG TPA: hypothetical protein VG963_31425 [Polyangiaceae bacterium]|nr:hypothetical protein [Polyangiaceae bacterium]
MMKKRLSLVWLLCACSSAPRPADQSPAANDPGSDAAGGGTDTGNPDDDRGTNAEGGLCDETESELGLDDATSLGVSAADLFAWVGGTHQATLAWQDGAASFGPEHGLSQITLEIQPLGAHFIDRSPAQGAGTSNGLAINTEIATIGGGDPCADSVALDVNLHLSTAGGALDETLETTLEARAGDFATGQVTLPTDALAGSFTVDAPPPSGFVARGAPKLNVEIALSKYGDRGQITLSTEFQSSDGQAVSQGGAGVLARFPADDECLSGNIGVPANQSVRGVSVDAVLASLNATSPARLDAVDATLELAFASNAQRVCVVLDGPESSPLQLQFPGTVQLSSSDQRMRGSIEVTLSGQAASGVLQSSSATANAFLANPADANAAVSKFAIAEPLDFSSYSGGSFAFRADASPSVATGSLTASAIQLPDCAINPPKLDPDAQGSPGCPGADLVPLWSASWSKP